MSVGLPTFSATANDLAWLSVAEASQRVRRGVVSPVELTRACLQRTEALNPKLDAYITVTGEQALKQAQTAEAEIRMGRWRGPLHGIPIALKDNIDTAGIRTTAASAQFKDRIPTDDAQVVRNLKSGGAILLGKANMDEFALGHSSRLSYYGPVHNPWNMGVVAGGSSGGSAAAVAAALCYAALGTDTGGSIRQPSAFCGVVGLRPGYGLVSIKGTVRFSSSLDQIGPMCRSARDAALVLQVISGVRIDLFQNKLSGLRLGIPRSFFYEGLEPEVEAAVRKALQVLERLTIRTVDVELPEPKLPKTIGAAGSTSGPEHPTSRLWDVIVGGEAAGLYTQMLQRNPNLVLPEIRDRINGILKDANPIRYQQALAELTRLRAAVDNVFKTVDLLVTPTTPVVASTLDSEPPNSSMRNVVPFSVYGLPALSIPCGFTANGLPIGMQLIGRRRGEALLLAFADEYEQATDWHTRHPALDI